MFSVQHLVFFKKKSLAEHAPQAPSKIIEAFFDKASVGLPQPGDFGGDFSIAAKSCQSMRLVELILNITYNRKTTSIEPQLWSVDFLPMWLAVP